MNRRTVAAALTAAVALSPVAVAASPAAADPPLGPDTYVTGWDATAAQAFTAAALTPAEGHTIFAYVGIAVYDAVMAVHPQYQPFLVDADAPAGTSAEAAVAAAAHRVLAHSLPGQATAILDPAYASSLATIADGQAKADGVALGEYVAAALIAERTGDGFRAPATYTPDPDNPAAWIPTAPSPPIGPYLGLMRPFALSSADQFRPAGPPALGTKKWARDYTEVKDIGSSTSTTRTPEQTVAARFWAEPPVQQARGSFRHFVTERGLDIVQAARFMGMVSVTYADALIACFDAKYRYAFWRPVTAIRNGHTDGNDATAADPTWTPLVGTPNHPEYPSAHSCITPAGGIVVSRFLGTGQIDFTVPSLTGLGDRHFTRAKDLEHDASNARIWGGIHYRTSVEDGATIANKTAHHVLAHHFRAIDD
ncbi:MAG TPA: vanadium-dependent haloperoxidase [Jiangellales bacterium]|nr:vanadium-dependent haloperoxidase [Jiangellales bacterium]